MLICDVLSIGLTVVVATPVMGLLLKLFLLTTEDGVLTDEDIAMFFVHPLGLVALVLLGGLALGAYLIELALIMVIGFGALEDRRVTYLDALRHVFANPAQFFRLSGEITVRALLLVAPFLAALGGIYLLLLDAHDINFYLDARPPEFLGALALAAGLLAVLAVLLLRTVAGWILALPLLLFTDVPAAQALKRSRELVAAQRWRVARFLAAWLVATALVSALATLLIGRLGGLLIPEIGGSWVLLAAGLAATLAVNAVVQLTLRIVSTSVIPLLSVRWFRDLAGPGQQPTACAEPGSLGARATWSLPGSPLLIAGAALLLLVLAGAYFAARTSAPDEPPTIIAHRGASAGAPENTMAAFELALADHSDWIELDVQEDADGTVIVAHDSDFMKQARLNLKVWEATADDLADIDIGSWFDPVYASERVPTLLEVLTWAKGRIGVVIELKFYGHDERLEARVVEIVEQVGSQSEVLIMSLSYPSMLEFAELRAEWPRGLLSTVSLGDVTRLDVNFLALNAAAATRRQIREAHARGLPVYVWTINDPLQMSMILSRGADGLITDEPGLAHEVLELREQLSPIGQTLLWIAGESGLLHIETQDSDATDA